MSNQCFVILFERSWANTFLNLQFKNTSCKISSNLKAKSMPYEYFINSTNKRRNSLFEIFGPVNKAVITFSTTNSKKI